MPNLRVRILNWFTYHAPHTDQPERYQGIRNAGKEFALVIAENVPSSDERNEAIKHVRYAVMWANAGIACNERRTDAPYKELLRTT